MVGSYDQNEEILHLEISVIGAWEQDFFFFKDFKKLRGRNEAEFIRWRCFEKFPISRRKFSWENELK